MSTQIILWFATKHSGAAQVHKYLLDQVPVVGSVMYLPDRNDPRASHVVEVESVTYQADLKGPTSTKEYVALEILQITVAAIYQDFLPVDRLENPI